MNSITVSLNMIPFWRQDYIQTIFEFFIVLHRSFRLTFDLSLKEKCNFILLQLPSPNLLTPSINICVSSSFHFCNTTGTQLLSFVFFFK